MKTLCCFLMLVPAEAEKEDILPSYFSSYTTNMAFSSLLNATLNFFVPFFYSNFAVEMTSE